MPCCDADPVTAAAARERFRMHKPKSDYTIQTVSNALRVLQVFNEEVELGVSELSRRLDLHKNNVFRLLATLESGGYVEQSSENDRYRLGVRCLELGQAYTRGHPLRDQARPVLRELVERLGETAHLGVLSDFEVAHLDGVQPNNLLLTASRVGQRLPVHCSALGKVLLGCSPPGFLESYDRAVVGGPGLPAFTAATQVDRHKLFEELRTVAGQGWAIDLGECADGLHCAAAPVWDADGSLLGSISVSGPALRLSEAVLHERVLPAVMDSAQSLSRSFGAAC
jgi:IclR family KDG regulon transcriptional repressor